MPSDPAPNDGSTFNIDAFVRDLATMAPTITSVMTMDQSQLSRICLKRIQEPGGREEIETATEALSDLAKRAQTFSGLATQAWLFFKPS